jgi:tetratricopeptide (TPR) repeat protein
MDEENSESNRSKPWYQKLLTSYFTWLIAAFLFVGSVLDTISNSIALITPTVSYAGCIILISAVVLIQLTLKRHPVKWSTRDGQQIRFRSLWPWVHILSLGVILSLLVPRIAELTKSTDEPKTAVGVTQSAAFNSTETFNILILPFEALEESKIKEIHIEKVLQTRLIDMSDDEELNLAVTYLSYEKSPLTFNDAIEVGRRHKANLVIWGNYYEQVHSDKTQLDLRYVLIDSLAPNVQPKGRTPVSDVYSLSLLQEGFLQKDIDYIIYWTLALREFAQEQYEKALNHFVYVESTFADKFAGAVDLKMDQYGISFSVNRPSLQLSYNLAFCYAVKGNYEQAIQYWNAVLMGGLHTAGGSRMVYDVFAMAIASSNDDAIRLCASALLNRASAFRETGKFSLAKEDYERFMKDSKDLLVLAPLYESMKDLLMKEINELSNCSQEK